MAEKEFFFVATAWSGDDWFVERTVKPRLRLTVWCAYKE